MIAYNLNKPLIYFMKKEKSCMRKKNNSDPLTHVRLFEWFSQLKKQKLVSMFEK